MPAASKSATSTVANNEKRKKAGRRNSGASGRTTSASWTSPPTKRQAADRCTQSAISDVQDEPASAAECPDNERPDANPSPQRITCSVVVGPDERYASVGGGSG